MGFRNLRCVTLSAGLLVLGLALAQPCCAPGPGVPGKRPDRRSPVGADAGGAAQRTAPRIAERVADLSPKGRVHLVSLAGPLDRKAAEQAVRALGAVGPGDAVVLELDAVGGELRAVQRVAAAVRRAGSARICFISGQALGEAALLPFACDGVALAPGARWGAVSRAQFSSRRLAPEEASRLAAWFGRAARRARRPVAWATAMVMPARSAGAKPARPRHAARPANAAKPQGGAKPVRPRTAAPRAHGRPSGKDTDARAGAPAGGAKPEGGKEAPPPGLWVQLTARQAVQRGMADAVPGSLAALLRELGWARRELLRQGAQVHLPGLARPRAAPRAVDPRRRVAGRRRVVVIDIHGTIELGLRSFVLRVLRQARPSDLVVLDIDTFGGRVDAATEMRDALLRSRAKTVAFINPRAISAGALLALACDLIAMVPGGSFGAATPIQLGAGGQAKPVGEKMVSYMRKEFKATAEAKGRRGDLAEAMVDMSVEVQDVDPGLRERISGLGKGKLLTLTTEEAMALRMAELRVESFEALRNRLGVRSLPVIRPSVNWAETISRFLTGPIVSGLLMTIGVLGLLLELYTPGFGVSGGIGIGCLLLFFFGHRIAGLAGWEPILLFATGVLLLGVEVFVTPGFGLLGSLGVLGVVGALFWTLLGPGSVPLHVSWEAGYVTAALVRVFLAVIAVFVLLAVALRVIPRGTGPFRRLVLDASIEATATEGAHRLPEGIERVEELLGKQGVAETALRPTGKIRVDGRRLEAESQGNYIPRGARVEIVAAAGRRIEVREVPG